MSFLKFTLQLTLVLLIAFLPVNQAYAQTRNDESEMINTRNMGGPRFGLTYVLGNGQLADELDHHNMGRTISQFGWHFEHQVVPEGGGPGFVIEFLPLLAGVEYGKIIPSFSLLMGVRSPGGWELGMGPNLSFSKTIIDEVEARTSLILGIGKSFNYGGVSIPVNVAFSASPEGDRISLFFGYAIASAKKKTNKKSLPEKRAEDGWSVY